MKRIYRCVYNCHCVDEASVKEPLHSVNLESFGSFSVSNIIEAVMSSKLD